MRPFFPAITDRSALAFRLKPKHSVQSDRKVEMSSVFSVALSLALTNGWQYLPIQIIDDVIADLVEHGKFWVIQWDIFSAAQNLKVILLLPLSTIPAFAASVIGATAIIAMLTLRSLRLVAFAAMVLFPPATVQVATTSFDEAARHCQHAHGDHCKTQASHSYAPPTLDIQITSLCLRL
jgi:hypothetical protein